MTAHSLSVLRILVDFVCFIGAPLFLWFCQSEAISIGAAECEAVIRGEFEFLRKLLMERERLLVDELHSKKDSRVSHLQSVDQEMESALTVLQRSMLCFEPV